MDKNTILSIVLSSAFAIFAGVVLGFQIANLDPTIGLADEVDAIPTNRPILSSVNVEDQKAGISAHVDSLKLGRYGGFAVVQKDDNGAPGDVIGVSDLLVDGKHIDFSIPLLVSTEKGEQYFVVVYYDDGDGSFHEGLDKVATYGSRGIVADVFIAL